VQGKQCRKAIPPCAEHRHGTREPAAQVGLVRRQAAQNDGRVVYVELTDEGNRRFAEAFEALAGERRALRKFVTKL
jgi:hypothetical protein